MDERQGVMTPDQEKLLDLVIKLSKAGEVVDGPAIKMIDNLGIERLKAKLKPEQLVVVYQIVDILFEGIAAMVSDEPTAKK